MQGVFNPLRKNFDLPETFFKNVPTNLIGPKKNPGGLIPWVGGLDIVSKKQEFRSFYDSTVRYASAILSSWGVWDIGDREDVLQNTYLEAFRSWERINDKSKRKAWFRTILRRQYAQFLAGAKVRVIKWSPVYEDDSLLLDPEKSFESKELCRSVIRELNEIIDLNKRQCLVAFFVECRPLKEISEDYDVNKSTLTTWCNRFRKKLTNSIASDSYGNSKEERGEDSYVKVSSQSSAVTRKFPYQRS